MDVWFSCVLVAHRKSEGTCIALQECGVKGDPVTEPHRPLLFFLHSSLSPSVFVTPLSLLYSCPLFPFPFSSAPFLQPTAQAFFSFPLVSCHSSHIVYGTASQRETLQLQWWPCAWYLKCLMTWDSVTSTSWLHPSASALAVCVGTEAESQLWHPYVSHSYIENEASEPRSPPILASACTCRPNWWLYSW